MQNKLNYEAKRDRWNGYDPTAFQHVIEEWNQVEEEQAKRKKEELEKKLANKAAKKDKEGYDSFEAEDSSDDSDIEAGAQVDKKVVDQDPRVRTMNRDLRNREDTAKYLWNLDPNSASYSGKSRTMNENPNPDNVPTNRQFFKGDNLAKFSGEYLAYIN
jgi:pre-mRNA-processing factor SLU7